MSATRQIEYVGADQRYAGRKPVILTLRAWIGDEEEPFAVRDVSHTGFLIETSRHFEPGTRIYVEVPNEGRKSARIVWSGNKAAGCEFIEPISAGSLSAALLQSDFRRDGQRPSSLALETVDEETMAEERMPGATRVLIIVAAAVAAWIPLLAIAYATFG